MARRPNGEVERRKTEAERRDEAAEALSLKVIGLSDHQIATTLQVSLRMVPRLVSKAVQNLAAQEVELLRAVEEVRLDFIRGGIGRIFADESETADNRMKAGALLLKVSESQRKLLGLDVPPQVVTAAEMEKYNAG